MCDALMIALFYLESLMCCPTREPRSGDVIPEVTIVAKKKKKRGEQPSECIVVHLPWYTSWRTERTFSESVNHSATFFESPSATPRGLCRTHLYISFCFPRAVYLESVSWCCMTDVSSAETSATLCFSSPPTFFFPCQLPIH